MRQEKVKIRFTKMHGSGNDYIYISTFKNVPNSNPRIDNPEGLAIQLSDRHFGIGGDGVILVCPPEDKANAAKMRMFNLDGSEGKMCGNGIRCVAKFLYDHGYVDINDTDEISIETLSGIKQLKVITQEGEVTAVKVNMGKAELKPELVPIKLDGESVINRPVNIGGVEYKITAVSMGNPHVVVFVNNVDVLDLEKIGPLFEFDEMFPERVNVEFVKVLNNTTLKMRVWERGSGETWACGTGACAVAMAACLNGHSNFGEDITVKLKGGNLVINATEDTVFMTGDAVRVFDGEVVR
jgi:carbamoyl-phosphate synthase large subunit